MSKEQREREEALAALSGKAYVTRIRGGGGYVSREFDCADHGIFDTLVQRGIDEPQPCPICGAPAEVTISAPPVHTKFVVTATTGRNEAKPHYAAMDTRSLGEGQSFDDWKAGRRRMWAEHRRKQLKDLRE